MPRPVPFPFRRPAGPASVAALAAALALAVAGTVIPGCSGGDRSPAGRPPETPGTGAPGSGAAGALRGWNVLLITLDTLRGDRLGFSGHGPAETPVLDGLAERGVVFRRAVATAPVTLPSHASILSGRNPPAHGALDNGFYSLPEDVPTLATTLQEAGYRTGAVIGAFVLHGQYGLDRGFDHYDDYFRNPRLPGQEHVERRADEVVGRARGWLAQQDPATPFFLWVHCFDPHSPYDPPEPFRSRFPDPYDGEIAFTDQQLGRLLEALRERGREERTLIVVVADHGEAFGDGGEETHGFLLRRSTLEVPLVLAAPGGLPAGRSVEGTVSTVDLLPTLTELLGVPAPEGIDGRSLLPAIAAGRADGRRAYSETRLPADLLGWSMLAGLRDDAWAYVQGPRPELYDLAADPGEARNLVAERPETASPYDDAVTAILATTRDASARDTLTEEEVEALNALGYVAGPERGAGGGADPKDMLALWRRVEDLQGALAAGQVAEALAGAREIVAADPGNPEAHLLLGQALLAAGDGDGAIEALRVAVAAGGSRGRAGTILADALARAGRADEAEELYRDLMRREPKLSEHPFNLGVLLWNTGRPAEAIAAYEKALARNPQAVHVLVNYAEALSTVPRGPDDAARAEQALQRAVQLSPDDDRPRLFQVFFYLQLGRREDAVAAADALAARPTLRGVSREEVENARRMARGG